MTDKNSFDQQVVLITAAASGLGRGIAIDLAQQYMYGIEMLKL